MTPSAHLSSVIELLGDVDKALAEGYKTPADATLAYYFRKRRYIGSKDRGAISRLFYYILRHKASLIWWAKQHSMTANHRILGMLGYLFLHEARASNLNTLCSGEKYAPTALKPKEFSMLEACAGQPLQQEAMPEATRYNIPEWLEKHFTNQYGEERFALYDALMQEASVDIRVNTLKIDRDKALHAIRKSGMDASPCPYSANGLRLSKRGALFNLEAFRQGWFEVQDEGSQLLASLVNARAGQRVIDFCAGAGGKTLAISATMQNKGKILAWDTSKKRLGETPKRLARAGVNNVETHLITSEQDSYIKRHKNSADWVLVDAPCTGTGTWRRNPDLKWRTSPQDLEELTALQYSILTSAARLPKPGGALVYATCSLLKAENNAQIQRFLAEQPHFSLEPITLHPIESELMIQLTPSHHGTDGFFAAILRKNMQE